jgi:hypothetical protein
MSDTPAAPSRGRQSRDKVEAASRERRYKPSEDAEGVDFNLWVDRSKLDPDYQYRWVNVTKNRVQRLYNRDWDQVSEEEVGFSTERHADIAPGAREDTRAVLMRKRKDWFNDDQNAKQKRIDDQMQRAATGQEIITGKGQDEGGGLSPAHAYKPKDTNQL